jgi:hypothetical protein
VKAIFDQSTFVRTAYFGLRKEIVQALVETLGFRHIGVVHDEYAVSPDGMKMFGVLDLDTGMHGCRFSIGVRNAHDKSMRLAMTVGYRVFVCENMAFSGDFEPVLAKHSKNFSLQNALSIGVDSMQRNFKPMVQSVASWREYLLDGLVDISDREAFLRPPVDWGHVGLKAVRAGLKRAPPEPLPIGPVVVSGPGSGAECGNHNYERHARQLHTTSLLCVPTQKACGSTGPHMCGGGCPVVGQVCGRCASS